MSERAPSLQKIMLVVGGTSDIGRATARAFAARGWAIRLAGRSVEILKREADDIHARTGVPVTLHALDVLATDTFPDFLAALGAVPDAVVCVAGLLGDQRRAETETAHAALVLRSNFEGPALLLGLLAEAFRTRGYGSVVGVSSVAGERGRAVNYVYGAAKAGLTAYLSGLRNRLDRQGVHVLTVKPGFVATRMTEGMALPPALTTDPVTVGEAIAAAVAARRDVIYVGRRWALVMAVIRAIPERVFKRLSI